MIDLNGLTYFNEEYKGEEIVFRQRPKKKKIEEESKFYKFISDENLHITRLDVAYDDHTGVLDIERVQRHGRHYRNNKKRPEGRKKNPDQQGRQQQCQCSD